MDALGSKLTNTFSEIMLFLIFESLKEADISKEEAHEAFDNILDYFSDNSTDDIIENYKRHIKEKMVNV